MTNTNKNKSFVIAYSFWSYILIAIVLFNYILFRSIVVDNNSFFYLITFIFDYIVLITFFLLVFYQFYNAIFNSNILLFLIFGTLKLYVMEINIHNIIEFLFFVTTLILTIKILFPIIKSKDTIELERGVYVFILLSLLASNINYIIISANKLIDSDIFHYTSTYISTYTSKLSSFSFLILIIGYILIFIKEIIMKNINKSFVFVILGIVLSILSIFSFGANFLLIIISFFNALGIVMYLPFTIYMVVMIMFFITLFSSFITSMVSKNYYPKLIIFTLLILAGLDMSNFSLRLISMFSILEMSNIQNYKKEDISYLTNNDL